MSLRRFQPLALAWSSVTSSTPFHCSSNFISLLYRFKFAAYSGTTQGTTVTAAEEEENDRPSSTATPTTMSGTTQEGASFKPKLISFISDVEGCPFYWKHYLDFNQDIVAVAPDEFDAEGNNASIVNPEALKIQEGMEEAHRKKQLLRQRREDRGEKRSTDEESDDGDQELIDFSFLAKELVMPREDTMLVFGGDVFDQGPADLAIARQLVQLKKTYPARVVLILGNRDINKMKLSSELSVDVIEDPKDVPDPFFHDCDSYATYLKNWRLSPSPASKLKWLLDCTMSSPKAFENRRKELGGSTVTDEEVVESFARSVKPGGAVYDYLHAGQLAAVANGTLFVHGAVTEKSAGFLPDPNWLQEKWNEDTPQGRCFISEGLSVQEWVQSLHTFVQKQLEDWVERPQGKPSAEIVVDSAQGGEKARGGSSLIAYPHNRALPSRYGIVSQRFDRPQLAYLDARVVMYLNTSGIFRVAAGHMPCGDSPVLVQQPGLLTVISDTSYCDTTAPFHSRGAAIAEVLFHDDGTTTIRGKRADGIPYQFSPEEYPLVGQRTKDGWWVKMVRQPVGGDGEPIYYNHDEHEGGGESFLEGADPTAPPPPAPEYLLHHTSDEYYTLRYEWITEEELLGRLPTVGVDDSPVQGEAAGFACLETKRPDGHQFVVTRKPPPKGTSVPIKTKVRKLGPSS